jgi:hypothetical protein
MHYCCCCLLALPQLAPQALLKLLILQHHPLFPLPWALLLLLLQQYFQIGCLNLIQTAHCVVALPQHYQMHCSLQKLQTPDSSPRLAAQD